MQMALVTYAALPSISSDDGVVARALEAGGVAVFPVIWQDASVEWTEFGLVPLRSTWDYHLHLNAFREFVDAVGHAT